MDLLQVIHCFSPSRCCLLRVEGDFRFITLNSIIPDSHCMGIQVYRTRHPTAHASSFPSKNRTEHTACWFPSDGKAGTHRLTHPLQFLLQTLLLHYVGQTCGSIHCGHTPACFRVTKCFMDAFVASKYSKNSH